MGLPRRCSSPWLWKASAAILEEGWSHKQIHSLQRPGSECEKVCVTAAVTPRRILEVREREQKCRECVQGVKEKGLLDLYPLLALYCLEELGENVNICLNLLLSSVCPQSATKWSSFW